MHTDFRHKAKKLYTHQTKIGGNTLQKRLRYYLDRITDNKTTTYRYNEIVDGKPVQKEIYDGECTEIPLKPNGDVDGKGDLVFIRREPTFWHNGIAYTFERTNKLSLDRPTVTIAIPATMLNVTTFTNPVADHCLREIIPYFDKINVKYANRSRPDKDNGKFIMHAPSSKVIMRNTSYFSLIPAMDYKEGKGNVIYTCKYVDLPPDIMCLCIRMEIQLPYLKLDRAKTMLLKQLPEATEQFLKEFDLGALNDVLQLAKTQQDIRNFLQNSEYCAFIANGSMLAREKGSDKPARYSIPFQSPAPHEIEIAGVKGMGIKRGVTVITGGGYSGKSTVLNAVSAGIYNHIAGDGRELCITDETAVTITAEDGRAVSCVNITPFIKFLPGSNPENFSTAYASGATSQAANIMEAVSLGSKLLLIDEDRSATNFMIRDNIMKKLIHNDPITPFTDRAQELSSMGTSTILVIGGSSEYLSVANDIFMMDEFIMSDATTMAKSFVQSEHKPAKNPNWSSSRRISKMFTTYPSGNTRETLSISDTGFIVLGDERIDIRSLHDITTEEQINALAFILRYLAKSETTTDSLEVMALTMRGLQPKLSPAAASIDILSNLQALYAQIETEGLDIADTGFFTTMSRFMELPRIFEVMAAINRMRHASWAK